MVKTFKYRLMPTPTQQGSIDKHIGCCRFIYNLALETKQMAYAGNRINISGFDLMKQLPGLKTEYEWLKDVSAQSLQQSIIHLDTAFTRFFKGHAGFPKFKKKTNGGSFNAPQDVVVKENKLFISRFREGVNIILHRKIKGEIRQATIKRTPTGKYFVSILCETGGAIKQKSAVQEKTSVGIDLGINNFLVSSDGKQVNNPRFLKKSLPRLKYFHSKYSKNKGKRTQYRLRRLYEIVANQRKDFLHKTSSELIKNHDTICIEDLNIEGMIKNHKLAQAITDVSWGEFVRQLEYKAEWYGKNIIRIGRFDPSSKTCSKCGSINKELTLKDREWTCVCGEILDRDVNAAINIKNFAFRNYLSGTDRKNRNELPALAGVLTSEATAVHMNNQETKRLTD